MRDKALSFIASPARAVVVAVLLLLATAFVVSGTSAAGGNQVQLSVVTLTGGPVTVDTTSGSVKPGDFVPVPLSPSSKTTFTQKAGQIVMLSLDATFAGNGDVVFCNVNAAAHIAGPPSTNNNGSLNETSALHMQTHFQRGGPWPEMFETGRDGTRTVPGPAVDTVRTVEAVAWMDPAQPGPDGCFGASHPLVPDPDQQFTVTIRLSIVRLSG